MKCEDCGKGLADGAVLLRQNPKGEIGRWKCSDCNKLPVGQDLGEVLSAIAGKEVKHVQAIG